MSDNLPNKTPQQSEEIDLGQLFKLIGNAFDRFFKFIANIFKGLFHLLIVFLLFLQKHFLKLAIAGVLGLATGFFFDYTEDTVYESEMILEPNFNSTQQLYNNVNFYNELALANDSMGLSIALGISKSEAGTIKRIEVDAFTDENQKIQLFDDFIKNLDSTTKSTIDYKSYLKNFNTQDSRFHKLIFASTNASIAKKVEESIVDAITDNAYFQSQKEISDLTIKLQEDIYAKQLNDIDNLQKFYKELALEEVKKENASTSINLADRNGEQNKELALIKQVDEIKTQIILLNQEKARKEKVINVISAFPYQGVEIKGVLNSNKLLFFGVFVGVMFLGLCLLELNKYLKTYKQKYLS